MSLMREKLPQRGWPSDVVDRVSHFIGGFDICAADRNDLMHSNVSLAPDAIILYKTSNFGKSLACNPTLAEIRKIADSIHAFTNYGLALSNAINFNLLSSVDKHSEWPWPDKPSFPHKLNYSGDSQAIRGLHDDI